MKDIEGFERLYAITSCGKVWSYRYNNFLTQGYDKDGYPRVILHKNKKCKTFFIHRLVAQAYLPNPDNLPLVNHKDEVKTHNWVSNLEWCTPWYNTNYTVKREEALKMGVTYEKVKKPKKRGGANSRQVRCIETGIVYDSGAACARAMSLDPSSIIKACKGKLYQTGGYHFEYYKEDKVI